MIFLLTAALAAPSYPDAPVLRLDVEAHAAPISGLDVDAAGRWAATASNDKTARVWDLARGTPERVLRPPLGTGTVGRLDAVSIAPDGGRVAAGGWTGGTEHPVWLFDRATGDLLRRLDGADGVVESLDISPDGRLLAAGDEHGHVYLWDLATGALRATVPLTGRVFGLAWSPDGRLAAASLGDVLVLLDDAGKELARVGTPSDPLSLAWSPDGAWLAVGYHATDRVERRHGRTLATAGVRAGTLPTSRSLASVAWGLGGVLAAAGQYDFDGRHPVLTWTGSPAESAIALPATSINIMGLRGLPDGDWLVADGLGGLTRVEGTQLTPLSAPPVQDLRGNNLRAGAAGQVAWRERDGRWWTWRPGQPPASAEAAPPTPTAPRRTSPHLALTEWKDTTAPKLNGRSLVLMLYETSNSVSLRSDDAGFVLGTSWYLRAYLADGTGRWTATIPDEAWDVAYTPDNHLVVATHGDGTVRWYRERDGQELLALFVHADGQRWVAWTPSGYYDANTAGEAMIGWHINRGPDRAADFFPAGHFRDRFFRPDVVARILDVADEAAAVSDADRARARTTPTVGLATVLPPVVTLLSPAPNTLVQSPAVLRVRLRSPSGTPIDRVRINVNGTWLGTPKDAAPPVRTSEGEERTLGVPLTEDSIIYVVAEAGGRTSEPATVRVRLAAPVVQDRPDLWVLAVGVGAWQDPGAFDDLRYPASDAERFAAFWRQQQGATGLYDQVHVEVLTDAKATRAATMEAMERLRRGVKDKDVAVLYFSGHGEMDTYEKLQLVPWDARPQSYLASYVPGDAFKELASTMPAHVLLFLDVCHAGTISGEWVASRGYNLTSLLRQLASTDVGAYVYSSSGRNQSSLEHERWRGGAFTSALLECLAIPGDNGAVTTDALGSCVGARVHGLTGGQQTPTYDKPPGRAALPVALPVLP
jgi:WD40 repeat protein